MVKCPYCGFDGVFSAFKLLRDPWRFRFYEVRMLECPKRHGLFNYYEGSSPKGKSSSFVIRVKPKVGGRVKPRNAL